MRIFVYGTLMRGGRYHRQFCSGARSIDEASVRGRLSQLPAGYPVLDVPEEDILAHGSADAEADMALLDRIGLPPPPPGAANGPAVRGEIMTFDDLARRLPALDRLEGFHPGRLSLYRRVALAASPRHGPPVPSWVYVRGDDGVVGR